MRENDATKLHENEAAENLRAICQGDVLTATAVKEGKIELKAARDGVFQVDAKLENAINDLGEICLATVCNNVAVRAGKSVAGMRVIPLGRNENEPRQGNCRHRAAYDGCAV